jgi:hypothetical protein
MPEVWRGAFYWYCCVCGERRRGCIVFDVYTGFPACTEGDGIRYLTVPILRHGLVFLCCCGSSERRRGCDEDTMLTLDVGISNISDGFPDFASGGSIRFCPFLVFIVAGGRFGRYGYRLEEKPGWVLDPALFGGSVPLWGSSSSGVLGALVLETSDSSVSDDVMADGHLFQPGRSAVTKQVGVYVLHKTTTKNFVSSPERRSASSSVLWPPVAKQTGRSLQGLSYNFVSFQGCSCKIWAVITKNFM